MAGGIAALLLKADDKNRWSVILHHADGRETTLPSATPAEHLITASEIDYSAYRREIRSLRFLGNVTDKKSCLSAIQKQMCAKGEFPVAFLLDLV